MNILQVHNYYQIPGGEDTVVENERQMLERHGHRVIQYTRNNKEFANAGALKKLRLYAGSFFSFRTFREVRQIIHREKVDLVHVHNTVHLISPSVFYAAVNEGVPVIQTLHNFRIQCPAATFYRNGHICEDCMRHGMGCAIRHKCYRGSRLQTAAVVFSEYLQRISGIRGKIRYICLTDFNRKKLLETNRKDRVVIPPEHVFVKPNFTPEKTAHTQDRGSSYYVSIGRLEHIKGTHIIVKAFAHTGFPLVLIGSGEMEERIRKYIKRHGITNIRLTGQLPHEEAMELLKNAKALVIMPQWYETFGMNVIEAYSLGVPVITNDIGNAAALVRETGKDDRDIAKSTGIKCKNTVKDLERALRRMEKADLQQEKHYIIQEYKTGYSEEKNYYQLKEIYKTILDK